MPEYLPHIEDVAKVFLDFQRAVADAMRGPLAKFEQRLWVAKTQLKNKLTELGLAERIDWRDK